jgi:hypothetical protein
MHTLDCFARAMAKQGSKAEMRIRRTLILASMACVAVALEACATAPPIDMTKLSVEELKDTSTLELEEDCKLYKSPNFIEALARRGQIDEFKKDQITIMRIRPGFSEAEVFCALPSLFSTLGTRQVTETRFGQQVTFVMPQTSGNPTIMVMLDHGIVTTVTYG